MARPADPFRDDPLLPPGIGALMSAAAAASWAVVLPDGRAFYLPEARARRFAAANPGSTMHPPASN
jgi:hypothetical protein